MLETLDSTIYFDQIIHSYLLPIGRKNVKEKKKKIVTPGFEPLCDWLECADPECFARGGPTLTFFLVDERREDPKSTKSGPSSARQRNAIWRFAGVPMMAQH